MSRKSFGTTLRLLAILLIPAAMLGLLQNEQPSALETTAPTFGFPDEFARYFHSITVPEGEERSGYTAGYRREALRTLQAARKGGVRLLPWVERGPGNVGGRTRGLVIDRNDPSGNTLLAGSVGGGIWRIWPSRCVTRVGERAGPTTIIDGRPFVSRRVNAGGTRARDAHVYEGD